MNLFAIGGHIVLAIGSAYGQDTVQIPGAQGLRTVFIGVEELENFNIGVIYDGRLGLLPPPCGFGWLSGRPRDGML